MLLQASTEDEFREHGEQELHAFESQTDGGANRRRAHSTTFARIRALVRERLDFEHERSRALHRHRRRRGDVWAQDAFAEEERRRRRHRFHAPVAHLKHPDFVRGAVAILVPAQDAHGSIGVALQVKHDVDDVLQHARTRYVAGFRDVTDDEHRHPRRFRRVQQRGGALAHLRHASRRPRRVLQEHRLNAVHDQRGRALADDRLEYRLEPRRGVHDETVGSSKNTV